MKQAEGEGHTENDKAGIENAQKVCMHEEDCKKSNRKHLAARGIFQIFGKHMGFLLKAKNGETFFLGLRNSLKYKSVLRNYTIRTSRLQVDKQVI